MGWMAPFEWASGKLLTGAGYVASPFSRDTAEFLWTAGNPNYTPPVFLQAAAPTAEGRKEQAAESNRYTKRVTEEIAPAVETTVVTAIQGLSAAEGMLVGSKIPVIGKVGGAVLGFEAGQDLVDAYLGEGEAPARSLVRIYSPVNEKTKLGMVENFVVDAVGARGDSHYNNGGLPDAHPLSKYNPANHPAPPPPEKSFFASIQDTAKGFLDVASKSTGLSFGMWSMIAAAAGTALAVFGAPVLGIGLLVGGGLFGQKLADMATAPATAPSATPPAPVTNHPRKEGAADPLPARPSPSTPIVVQPAKSAVVVGAH